MRRHLWAGLLVLVPVVLAVLFWPSRSRPGRLDDLAADPLPVLLALPSVQAVSRDGPSGQPAARIVHVLDWHLIPPDLHALDAGKAGQSYEEHLADVEQVQAEQVELLLALIGHHGPGEVLVEGLTEEGVEMWNVRVEALQHMASRQGEIQALLEEARRQKHPGMIQQALDLIEQHRRDRLELGAVAWLQAQGNPLRALPLDDAVALDAADPRRHKGKIDPDTKANREAAIVRRAITEAKPVAVLILGGAHDLADEIRRQAGGRVEYLRVATGAYRQVTEK
jgi:hypothetical protein